MGASIMGKTVLIVEDNRTEQLMLEVLLSNAGWQVMLAQTAEAALSLLEKKNPPDLILMDIVMPGVSGFELCRQVRTTYDDAEVPIIFCSSKNQDFDRYWALRQGGNEYITKPYQPKELIRTVSQYLDKEEP